MQEHILLSSAETVDLVQEEDGATASWWENPAKLRKDLNSPGNNNAPTVKPSSIGSKQYPIKRSSFSHPLNLTRVREEINTEAYDRLRKVFDFSNYKG